MPASYQQIDFHKFIQNNSKIHQETNQYPIQMNEPILPLSEDQLKAAFETLKWPAIEALLSGEQGEITDPSIIPVALRRANGLIFRYPDPQNERKRESMLVSLKNYFSSSEEHKKCNAELEDSIALIQMAENGYRKIVDALKLTDASKLDPATHVSAAIERAEQEVSLLFERIDNEIRGRKTISAHMQFSDESGNPFNVDSVLQQNVNFVGLTIKMESFRGKWFDSNDIAVVPVLHPASESQIYQAGATLQLAMLWNRWQQTEENARFLSGNLTYLQKSDWPENIDARITTIVRHEQFTQLEAVHRVASERMGDMLGQSYMEMLLAKKTSNIILQGAKSPSKMPPLGFLSQDELHACHVLSDTLAYDIFQDNERPGGLRLVEWVRGYVALKKYSEEHSNRIDRIKSESNWVDYLVTHGFSPDNAKLFIDRVTFRRQSRDLFDHPFVRHSDGTLQLFRVALLSMNIPQVVLSSIGQLKAQLQKKGKSFERAVRRLFTDAGLETYSFKEKRGNEEYEYDVLLPWGDYLFVFECKNRSLPHGNPVLMHYFDMESVSNVEQVKRLMRGLEEHPDMLKKHLPPGSETKQRIPIVLNCLPYALPGGADGVFFYDYSALRRFFKSAQIVARKIEGGIVYEEPQASVRLWEGNSPMPGDLIDQIKLPLQFKAVWDTLVRIDTSYPLPPEWWVETNDLHRRAAFPES